MYKMALVTNVRPEDQHAQSNYGVVLRPQQPTDVRQPIVAQQAQQPMVIQEPFSVVNSGQAPAVIRLTKVEYAEQRISCVRK